MESDSSDTADANYLYVSGKEAYSPRRRAGRTCFFVAFKTAAFVQKGQVMTYAR